MAKPTVEIVGKRIILLSGYQRCPPTGSERSQARVDSDPRDEKVTAIRDQKSRCRGVRLHGWKMDACGLIDRASDLLVACSSI